jgi:hypothetical protein
MNEWIYRVELNDGPSAITIREIGEVLRKGGYPAGINTPQNGDGWTYMMEKPLREDIIRSLLENGFIKSIYSPWGPGGATSLR